MDWGIWLVRSSCNVTDRTAVSASFRATIDCSVDNAGPHRRQVRGQVRESTGTPAEREREIIVGGATVGPVSCSCGTVLDEVLLGRVVVAVL